MISPTAKMNKRKTHMKPTIVNKTHVIGPGVRGCQPSEAGEKFYKQAHYRTFSWNAAGRELLKGISSSVQR